MKLGRCAHMNWISAVNVHFTSLHSIPHHITEYASLTPPHLTPTPFLSIPSPFPRRKEERHHQLPTYLPTQLNSTYRQIQPPFKPTSSCSKQEARLIYRDDASGPGQDGGCRVFNDKSILDPDGIEPKLRRGYCAVWTRKEGELGVARGSI